ncbi:hypothetical protein D3C86_1393090 [compost metagenome]
MHRRVKQADQIGKGIAEETGHAQGHIDPRTVEQTQRQNLEIIDPLAAGGPDRAHAHQRHGLGNVIAAGAHGRGAPHRQTELAQMIAVVLQVPLQNQVGRLETDAPRRGGRQIAHVHRVEVTPGGQHVQATATRRTAGAGRDEATAEGVEQTAHFRWAAGVQARGNYFAKAIDYGTHFSPTCLLWERACSRKRWVNRHQC